MKEVTRWTKEAGIEIRGSFMIGLPGETPELARETIQHAIDLDPEYAQFSITTPYPGTKLFHEINGGKWGKLTTEDFSEFQGWNVVFLPDGYKDKAGDRYCRRPLSLSVAVMFFRDDDDDGDDDDTCFDGHTLDHAICILCSC